MAISKDQPNKLQTKWQHIIRGYF